MKSLLYNEKLITFSLHDFSLLDGLSQSILQQVIGASYDVMDIDDVRDSIREEVEERAITDQAAGSKS